MLDLSPGATLHVQGQAVRVVRASGLDRLLVEDLDTGRLREVDVADVRPAPRADGSARTDNPAPLPADSAQQEEAQHRYSLIAPLLNLRPRSKRDVEARASEVGASVATLYRLMAQFENNLSVDALARRKRSDTGGSRFPPEVVTVMDEVIQAKYLNRQQHSIKKTYLAVVDRCDRLGLTAPSLDTVARRIRRLHPRERVRRRQGQEAAEGMRLLRGVFPGANAPLDVVQLDHTLLDVMITDAFEREEIGRPTITVAMDVYSRVVTGFHISLDAPSFMAAGSCLAQSILPKDQFLAPRQKRLTEIWSEAEGEDQITGAHPTLRWPVWGKPTKVHADNAREFRGKMLERSCHQYGIHVELRPVKTPWYGGHIERLMGTIATELHDLPGTTFSNPQRRGTYQSQKRAVLTLDELDLWLTVFFAGIYNQRPHSALNGQSPIEVFEHGLLQGTPDAPPKGLPPLPTPEEALKLRIDFLPSFEVTVQRYGVRLDTVTYYHEVLEPLLARRTPGKPSEKHVVRRDPRDLSQVYFFVPEADEGRGRYYAIPFADSAWQRLSIWELKELKRRVRPQPGTHVKERDLIQEQRAMKRIVERSGKVTRETHRDQARKRTHDAVQPLMTPEASLRASPAQDDDELIVPFEVQH